MLLNCAVNTHFFSLSLSIRSGRTSFDPMAYRSLDVMLTKTASLVEQGEDDSDDSDSDTCLSWETHSTSEEEGATGDTKQKA